MNAENLQLFWRIRAGEQAGQEAVSLLMPAPGPDQETEFPTSVSFKAQDARRIDSLPHDLRWSDEDSDLFMSLLDRVTDDSDETELVLDVSDELVQGIVQLVALVRFKSPWDAADLVGRDINVPREELEIGDLVAINTRYGFTTAIVVGLDSIDVTVILLEAVCDAREAQLLPEHSVLLVNRMSVVSATFCDAELPSDERLQ